MVKHIKRETIEESSDSHQLLSFSKLGLLLKVRIFFLEGQIQIFGTTLEEKKSVWLIMQFHTPNLSLPARNFANSLDSDQA